MTQTVERAATRRRFDPAAAFLLDLGWENLFDPTGKPTEWRCKGCDEIVRMTKRREHHAGHKQARRRLNFATGGGYPATANTAGSNSGGADEPHPITERNETMTSTTQDKSKTQIAKEAAVAVLKSANAPLTKPEIMSKALDRKVVKDAGIEKGMISAQIYAALNEGTIERVGRGTYAVKGAPATAPAAAAAAPAATRTATRTRSASKKPAAAPQATPDPKPAAKRSTRSSGRKQQVEAVA